MNDDWVLVGGGLQNCLLALSLLHHRPDVRLTLVEREATLGGGRTWSFHATDAPPQAAPWIDPLVVASWPRVEVAFPNLARTLDVGYRTISGRRMHEVVVERFARSPGAQILHDEVASVCDGVATTHSGKRLTGTHLVDSRGPRVVQDGAQGFQKFLGLEIKLEQPCAPTHPILMDAVVPQTDGYRFFYTLPLDAKRILVEDTYYADGPALDLQSLRTGVLDYAARRGWKPAKVLREETGVLPIPWREATPAPGATVLQGGYAGGWHHPTTGYSFPCAVRLALTLTHTPAEQIPAAVARLRRRRRRQARFLHWLNWMLFHGFAPGDRWGALERFHRLPLSTIQRFYAMELTASDRFRILCGRPPHGFSLRMLLGTRRAS